MPTGRRPFNPGGPTLCDLCEVRFSSLKIHQRVFHNSEDEIKCVFCGIPFVSSSALTRHLDSHADVSDIFCCVCLLTFETTEALSAHLETHSELHVFLCAKCKRTFQSRRRLIAHECQPFSPKFAKGGCLLVENSPRPSPRVGQLKPIVLGERSCSFSNSSGNAITVYFAEDVSPRTAGVLNASSLPSGLETAGGISRLSSQKSSSMEEKVISNVANVTDPSPEREKQIIIVSEDPKTSVPNDVPLVETKLPESSTLPNENGCLPALTNECSARVEDKDLIPNCAPDSSVDNEGKGDVSDTSSGCHRKSHHGGGDSSPREPSHEPLVIGTSIDHSGTEECTDGLTTALPSSNEQSVSGAAPVTSVTDVSKDKVTSSATHETHPICQLLLPPTKECSADPRDEMHSVSDPIPDLGGSNALAVQAGTPDSSNDLQPTPSAEIGEDFAPDKPSCKAGDSGDKVADPPGKTNSVIPVLLGTMVPGESSRHVDGTSENAILLRVGEELDTGDLKDDKKLTHLVSEPVASNQKSPHLPVETPLDTEKLLKCVTRRKQRTFVTGCEDSNKNSIISKTVEHLCEAEVESVGNPEMGEGRGVLSTETPVASLVLQCGVSNIVDPAAGGSGNMLVEEKENLLGVLVEEHIVSGMNVNIEKEPIMVLSSDVAQCQAQELPDDQNANRGDETSTDAKADCVVVPVRSLRLRRQTRGTAAVQGAPHTIAMNQRTCHVSSEVAAAPRLDEAPSDPPELDSMKDDANALSSSNIIIKEDETKELAVDGQCLKAVSVLGVVSSVKSLDMSLHLGEEPPKEPVPIRNGEHVETAASIESVAFPVRRLRQRKTLGARALTGYTSKDHMSGSENPASLLENTKMAGPVEKGELVFIQEPPVVPVVNGDVLTVNRRVRKSRRLTTFQGPVAKKAKSPVEVGNSASESFPDQCGLNEDHTGGRIAGRVGASTVFTTDGTVKVDSKGEESSSVGKVPPVGRSRGRRTRRLTAFPSVSSTNPIEPCCPDLIDPSSRLHGTNESCTAQPAPTAESASEQNVTVVSADGTVAAEPSSVCSQEPILPCVNGETVESLSTLGVSRGISRTTRRLTTVSEEGQDQARPQLNDTLVDIANKSSRRSMRKRRLTRKAENLCTLEKANSENISPSSQAALAAVESPGKSDPEPPSSPIGAAKKKRISFNETIECWNPILQEMTWRVICDDIREVPLLKPVPKSKRAKSTNERKTKARKSSVTVKVEVDSDLEDVVKIEGICVPTSLKAPNNLRPALKPSPVLVVSNSVEQPETQRKKRTYSRRKLVLKNMEQLVEKYGVDFSYKGCLKVDGRFHCPDEECMDNDHRGYNNEKVLRNHIKMNHLDVKCPTCVKCGKSFATNSRLKEHELIHSDALPYPCKECGKAFKTAASLKQHSGTHGGGWECFHCSKTTSTKRMLVTHFGDNPFWCYCCDIPLFCMTMLAEHERDIEHRYQCPLCPRTYQSRFMFNRHIRVSHYDQTTALDGKFQCRSCQRKFTSQKNLYRHMRRTHDFARPSVTVKTEPYDWYA